MESIHYTTPSKLNGYEKERSFWFHSLQRKDERADADSRLEGQPSVIYLPAQQSLSCCELQVCPLVWSGRKFTCSLFRSFEIRSLKCKIGSSYQKVSRGQLSVATVWSRFCSSKLCSYKIVFLFRQRKQVSLDPEAKFVGFSPRHSCKILCPIFGVRL